MRELPLQLGCAGLYLAIALLSLRGGRGWLRGLIVLACLLTAGTILYEAAHPAPPASLGLADLVRALGWFAAAFALYAASTPRHRRGFALIGLSLAALGSVGVLGAGAAQAAPISLEVLTRLVLAVATLLLLENLYFGVAVESRWHIAPFCVAVGGFAVFDIVLCSELVLFRQAGHGLFGARLTGTMLVAPLLLASARRLPRPGRRLHLSRSAAFHSATLILSGAVILLLALLGVLLRTAAAGWGAYVQASLAFAASVGIALLLTTSSARSRLQRLVLDHFFSDRYDYRREWLACLRLLSGEDDATQSALPARAVRVVAAVVDSPAGALFLRDPVQGAPGGPGALPGSFLWAGSWNLPAVGAVPAQHPLLAALRGGSWIACDDPAMAQAPLDGLGPLWLAVPLLGPEGLLGFVLVSPPRAPFQLDGEVFQLLRTVAREVATYLSEQRATQRLLQARDLHEYGKRFAFVAHDIKNVSSQLGLMLANARHHIQNPEFQKDMLETVESSVRKIGILLARLERPRTDAAPAALSPIARLEALAATYRRVRGVSLVVEHDEGVGTVAMAPEAFEAAVTHLLNNAVEASAAVPGAPAVLVRIRHEVRQVVIEIVDRGPGMSAEFIRDRLFRPFETSKRSGSGIGAWQARELLRAAGGDLDVVSRPGEGTVMRLCLPRTDAPAAVVPAMEPAEPAR